MFPDVESGDRDATAGVGDFAHDGVVLVGGGADAEFSLFADAEPSPARAEAGHGGFGEGFFESVERAEVTVDGGGEVSAGGGGSAGLDGVPEEGVVEVATSVVANGTLNGFRKVCEGGDEFTDFFISEFGVAFESSVKVGYVGVVVLAVMDFHGAGIDVRFEGIVGVSEFGK